MDIEESERQRIETEKKRWGDRTEEWLCDAAMRGDVGSLKEIIANDEYILDKVLVGGFKGKNPLHVAISTGQREFVVQLLTTKPELAEVVDTELGTALHIASSKGHVEIVEHLVGNIPGMCMTRNREGNNPLHIAAMKGKVEVLKVLLRTSPQAAQVRVDQGYTILHLCVIYNQLESLEVLLHEFLFDPDFIASTDTNGNNILHLAVFNNQYEMVKYVVHDYKALGRDSSLMNVNAVNKSGRTALDIFVPLKSKVRNQTESEIEDLLHKAGAKRAKDCFIQVEEPKWMTKRRNAIMIVCSLVATMAFQVGVNPPSGVWLDSSADHKVGKSILAYNYPYSYSNFMYVNTLGFLLSLSTIFMLILSLPEPTGAARMIRGFISWSIIMTMAYSYTCAVFGISPNGPEKQGTSVSFGVITIAILWAGMMTALLYKTWFDRIMEMIYDDRDWQRSLPKADGDGGDKSRSVPKADGENQSPV